MIANIGALCVFKYYNFFIENFDALLTSLHISFHFPFLNIILPIGLSFHTFQAMSYTIEVYRGNQKAERHFGIYALYVMFFPQLVAGPIERPQNLLHQFREKHFFDFDNTVIGLNLIVFGLFKKVVIADRLGEFVDKTYSTIDYSNTVTVFLAIVFYTIQVFADFSGYSDIARGTAKFLGFDLMLNFDKPFISKNVSEFWRRWHISLSTWLRDYLYTPIALEKRNWGVWGLVFALLFTFFISGLWHGAGWHYIIWGLIEGAAISFEVLSKNFRRNLSKTIPLFLYNSMSLLLTYLFQCFAWIFFRAENMHQVRKVFGKLAEFNFSADLTQMVGDDGVISLLITVLLIIFLIGTIYFPRQLKFRYNVVFLSSMVFLIIILGKDVASQFIYFQF